MSNTLIGAIQIVRVKMTDNLVGGRPTVALWVAATSRGDAVQAVKRKIPPHWDAELTDQHLTPQQVERLKLRPGDVSELSSAAT